MSIILHTAVGKAAASPVALSGLPEFGTAPARWIAWVDGS